MNKHEDKINPLILKLIKWMQPPGRILTLLVLTILSITSVAYVSNSAFEASPTVTTVYKPPDVPHQENLPFKGISTTRELSRLNDVQKRSDDNFLLKFKRLPWSTLSPQALIDFLIPYDIMEPTVSPNISCQPEPLPKLDHSLCYLPNTQNIFNGELRTNPVKIVHAIKLGYDVDVLEIHLNELYDVIDYFIITEAVESHFSQSKKPLIWELVKLQPRFAKFRDKVIHFVIDDADINERKPDKGIFGPERLQEKIRWEKLKKWSSIQSILSNDDIIGFGDADEIVNRLNVFRLRHCKLKVGVFDIGSWFAFGDLKTAFRSDFPLPGFPYTLGNPTFWTFEKAMKKGNISFPTYQRGFSGAYLLGGIHLTHYSFIPFLFVKALTATEAHDSLFKLRQIADRINERDINSVPSKVANYIVERVNDFMRGVPRSRFIDINELIQSQPAYKHVIKVPWFLKCNPDRYPSWYGKYSDSRILKDY